MPIRDLRQGQKWAKYLSYLGWKTERVGLVVAYVRNLGIVGSLIKISRASKLPHLFELDKLKKKYRPLQITFEPGLGFTDYRKLAKLGFVKDKYPLSPSKTIFIDLSQSEKKLLTDMHQKTRYNIKLSQKNGLEVVVSDRIDDFCKLWIENMKRKGKRFLLPTKDVLACFEAFEKNARLILVYKKNELLAGVLLILDDKIGHYMFAASNDEGNRLFAPTMAAWEAIRISKREGVKIFDFEGIYDKRYDKATKNWKGFSRFKAGFGGREIEFPQVYTKYYLPLLKIISKII